MKWQIVLIFFFLPGGFASGYTSNISRPGEEVPLKKSLQAARVSKSPEIDGFLDESVWKNKPVATDFYQYFPYNGDPATYDSEVTILYDDRAIYVGAMLYDPSPDSIYTQLSSRDIIGSRDHFGIFFDPFNDGATAYGFFVTASGVQEDRIQSVNDLDDNWDAVWRSAVRITDIGWVVEMEIPYSSLRFPQKEVQTWGLNIFRNIERYKETSTWNFINRQIEGINNQAGVLTNLVGIEPPIRLSLTPYASSYYEINDGMSSYSIRGGVDLRYGINESFTLDMMLIPDFGQVQSDNRVLNLSPFEVYNPERRQFFMEDRELFNKANLLYTRRIGGRPAGRNDAKNQLQENEILTGNPDQAQLVNATKVSGKTKKGLSLGVLNALTQKQHAEVEDTVTGETREILTQPNTNYNLVVVNQALKNNSFISFINTNVARKKLDYRMEEGGNGRYVANVTGTEYRFATSDNTYAVSGDASLSQIYDDHSTPELGFVNNISLEKISGTIQYGLNSHIESDKYDPNDFGFNTRNNNTNTSAFISYNLLNPKGKFLSLSTYLSAGYRTLYKPFTYTGASFESGTFMRFLNQLTLNLYASVRPFDAYDYFEPRVQGRYFVRPESFYTHVILATDNRKPFSFRTRLATAQVTAFDQEVYTIELRPFWRINDQFSFSWAFRNSNDLNDIGYVEDINDTQIFFGKRDVRTTTNTISFNYYFNNISNLNFRMRHYLSSVDYLDYFELTENGHLDPVQDYSADNRNFNTFNIDMVYTWNFAPGSELSLMWKNAIVSDQDELIDGYFNNVGNMFAAPQRNQFSLRVMYFLDYLYLKDKV